VCQVGNNKGMLLLLFIQVFCLDPSGSLVAPRVHSNYYKDIHSLVIRFECWALELAEFLFVFRPFRNLHGFKSSGASASANVTRTRHLDISLGLVIKHVRSKLTPEHELHMTVGFYCDNYWPW
jgi:hypothetical protein